MSPGGRPPEKFAALTYGLAVSPDRKTFLFSKSSDAGGDLMLIENFR